MKLFEVVEYLENHDDAIFYERKDPDSRIRFQDSKLKWINMEGEIISDFVIWNRKTSGIDVLGDVWELLDPSIEDPLIALEKEQRRQRLGLKEEETNI